MKRKNQVNGIAFEVFSDYTARATFATNMQTGETKTIRRNGYLSNELSERKAIATAFQLPTFRKQKAKGGAV